MRRIYILSLSPVAIAIFLALFTYIPVHLPIVYHIIFAVAPLLGVIVCCLRVRKVLWKFWVVSWIAFVMVFGSLYLNSVRYESFTSRYTVEETSFNLAAREFMPKLDSISGETEVAHYHGKRFWDEWVVLKTKYPEEMFDCYKEEVLSKHSFYDSELVVDEVFSISESEFILGNYLFQLVDLQAQHGGAGIYAAAIAVSETDNSILYIFLSSEQLTYMGPSDLIEYLWSNLGVPVQ